MISKLIKKILLKKKVFQENETLQLRIKWLKKLTQFLTTLTQISPAFIYLVTKEVFSQTFIIANPALEVFHECKDSVHFEEEDTPSKRKESHAPGSECACKTIDVVVNLYHMYSQQYPELMELSYILFRCDLFKKVFGAAFFHYYGSLLPHCNQNNSISSLGVQFLPVSDIVLKLLRVPELLYGFARGIVATFTTFYKNPGIPTILHSCYRIVSDAEFLFKEDVSRFLCYETNFFMEEMCGFLESITFADRLKKRELPVTYDHEGYQLQYFQSCVQIADVLYFLLQFPKTTKLLSVLGEKI